MINWLKSVAFSAGYSMYSTRAGLLLHRSFVSGYTPHSKPTIHELFDGALKVIVMSVNKDNFSYLLIDSSSNHCFAVDPCDADRAMLAVTELSLELKGILTTHGHWDHAGGNEALAAKIPSLAVYGSSADSVSALTAPVKEGDIIDLGDRIRVQVIEAACHTRGHVLYKVFPRSQEKEGSQCALFTGDTLFVAGCGKFFEGTPAEMEIALDKIRVLPEDTLIFCGHEYAVSNLKFCCGVEPSNESLKKYLERCATLRQDEMPTVPTTLREELQHNPFLRCGRDPALTQALKTTLKRLQDEGHPNFVRFQLEATAASELGLLRSIKDSAWPFKQEKGKYQ